MKPDLDPALAPRTILRYYLPLVLTSLLTALTGPVMNVALGRSAEPTLQLAAFWIAFTVVLFLQSACQVIPQVTLALATGRDATARLAASAVVVGAASSLVVLGIAHSSLADVVFGTLIPTSPRVAALARTVLADLSIAPALIAVRGWVQGQALGARRTRLVAAATSLRVLVLAAVALVAAAGGARAAAAAFLAGTAAETLLLAIGTRRIARDGPALTGGGVRFAAIARLLGPLAVAAFLWAATRPVVHAVLGRLDDPGLAQAAFGVVLPILMITCSPLWPLQDVLLALARRADDVRRIERFAFCAAVVFSAAIAILAWTPIGRLVLRFGFGLSPQLEEAVAPALVFLVLEPWLLASRAILQGLLTRAGHTGLFLVVPPVRLLLLLAVGCALADQWPHASGAALGLGLVLGGDLVDVLVYGLRAAAGRAQTTGHPATAGDASRIAERLAHEVGASGR